MTQASSHTSLSLTLQLSGSIRSDPPNLHSTTALRPFKCSRSRCRTSQVSRVKWTDDLTEQRCREFVFRVDYPPHATQTTLFRKSDAIVILYPFISHFYITFRYCVLPQTSPSRGFAQIWKTFRRHHHQFVSARTMALVVLRWVAV